MVSKGRHPKNAINSALAELDTTRFTVVETHHGHQWGYVRCNQCGATAPIWSTPRVPENNAKLIGRFATQHCH